MRSSLKARRGAIILSVSPDAKPKSGRQWLAEAAHKLKSGGQPDALTVRQLLRLFGYYRRGYFVVREIRRALESRGLVTVPDFEDAWIDAHLRLDWVAASATVKKPESTTALVAIELKAVEATLNAALAAPTVSPGVVDPTHRIWRLDAANRQVVSVQLDDPLTAAVTEMLKHDYSQLPILQGEREVKGMITWASIGSRLALGQNCQRVRDCLEVHREVAADTSLFDAIGQVVAYGYVLVRATDRRISGIVTASDLSLEFRQLTEPFLLLSEIEQHLRKRLEGKYSKQELQSVRDPGDTGRQIEDVADLTLGECIRLIENPDRWGKLGLNLSRNLVVNQLHEVRRIRNEVMHFDPDPLDVNDISTLRKFAHFLRRLDSILQS